MAEHPSNPGLLTPKPGSFQHFAASARCSLQGELDGLFCWERQKGESSSKQDYPPLPSPNLAMTHACVASSTLSCRRKGHFAAWRWKPLFSVLKQERNRDPGACNLERQLGPT